MSFLVSGSDWLFYQWRDRISLSFSSHEIIPRDKYPAVDLSVEDDFLQSILVELAEGNVMVDVGLTMAKWMLDCCVGGLRYTQVL